MSFITLKQLDAARQNVVDFVPEYNVKKLDVQNALESGVGNCFAKAVIAAAVISIRHSVEVSTSYSTRLHATPKAANMLGKSNSKNFAHIALLAPVEQKPDSAYVPSLCFGILGKTGVKMYDFDPGDVLDYNELFTRATVDPISGEVTGTPIAAEDSLLITNWREGAQSYLSALEREPIDFDKLFSTLEEKGIKTEA